MNKQRPRPTVDDVLSGVGGAQSGYLDKSYLQNLESHGDWTVERIRAVRRPIGKSYGLPDVTTKVGGLLGTEVFRKSKIFGGFEFSKGQDRKIHHTFLDVMLKDPKTGKRQMMRIEKGPTVKATLGNGSMAGEPDGNAILVKTPNDGSISFRDFSKKSLQAHADAHGGDMTAIGRYDIANKTGSNCQAFSSCSLKGAGLLTPELKEHQVEENVSNLPAWLQNRLNERARNVQH